MNAISPLPIDTKIDINGLKRTALDCTTSALAYLIQEYEQHGKLDHINMAHAYSAEALGRAVLAVAANQSVAA